MLILVSTTACLIFLLLQLSSNGMMTSFEALEQKEVKKNVMRVQDAFDQKVAELHGKSTDWSSWDDSYQFMKDRNQAYITSNLDVVNMKVDAIVFVGDDAKVFHARSLKRTADKPQPDPAVLVEKLDFVRHIKDGSADKSATSGFVLHNGIPTIVSVRPILPSSGKGVQHGWLVFASYLRQEDVAAIGKSAHLDIKLFSVADQRSYPAPVLAALPFLKSSNDVIARPLDGAKIHGYTYLKDINRKPIEIIQTGETREIFIQGQDETQFLVRIIAFAGTAFSLVVLLAIERNIIARLGTLSKQVDIIRSESDLTKRVQATGEDEISALSVKINEMLDGLEASTDKLRHSEDKLRLHSENLESTVLERTQEIEHLAYHDKLTGLPNRSLLLDRIDLALKKDVRNQKGTAVMFIDLDNFKLVNDSLGHSFGDQLLIEVTKVLSSAVRPGDTVARIGGDEFTVLLEDLESINTAEDVARRILAMLKQPILLGNRETFAGASIGIVYSRDCVTDGNTLLKHADTAMYRAKAAGKSNFVAYDESMHDDAIDRLELETSMRKALGNGEIFVEYQPLIDLETNKMTGAEALARWDHPVRGSISPTTFIPIAEDTGLIVPIGYWILEEACRQAKSWADEYELENFSISVNLSGKQLQHNDVVQRIQGVLSSTGLPPAQLKLEITESILMEDREDIIEKMFQLKSIGVQLALDDFGTGYSSLSTLRSFPIDTLKIDRAFISRLGEEDSALPIVEAILGLAKTMHMTVIGEGVENRNQEDIIRGLGCQIGQGYYYDQPLRAEKFVSRLLGTEFYKDGLESKEAA
jgi:diguanylate cyclase (GGDEF)-like protein